jgi:hypothetical protein
MVVVNTTIDNDKQYTSNAEDFDHHGDAAEQCGIHSPMEHIPGFTKSHWGPPAGKCLRSIAPVAVMVNNFIAKHKILAKHYFQLANLR